MIRHHELADQERELFAPLIPQAATGRPRVSDRQVINGVVYKIRTGISWRPAGRLRPMADRLHTLPLRGTASSGSSLLVSMVPSGRLYCGTFEDQALVDEP